MLSGFLSRFLLWLVLAVAASTVWAQVPRSPDSVVALGLRADAAHDWRVLLKLLHPNAIKEFQRGQAESLNPESFFGFPEPRPDTCVARIYAQYRHAMLDTIYHVSSW